MIFATVSYGAAAVGYGLLAALLLFSRQSSGQGRWLLAAVAGTSVWGALIVATLWIAGDAAPLAANSADALRGFLWTLCLLRALSGIGWQTAGRLLTAGAGSLVVLAAVVPPLLGAWSGAVIVLGSAVLVCLAVEQLFRNATVAQKRMHKPFLWTITAIFGYDLFVFSNGVLVHAIDTTLWAARGLFAALAVPVMIVYAKRHPDWTKTLFISRHVVFYSATLTSVGVYLIAMALAGELIRREGGQWGGLVQFVFFVAAIVLLGIVLSSARLRAAGRMFVTKHFYRNQYEYRDEWLRLIRTLTASDQNLPIDQRSIKALAEIVGSPGGQLWLDKEGRYEPFAAWQADFPTAEYLGDSALVRFLRDQGWVIDSAENDRDPERYNHAFSAEQSELPTASFIVPLFHQHELLGFARLIRPHKHRALNYEDHDLLKTAGRQVAAFLAHDIAMEQLTETRQFEAYSKLSAFVMHDLKNLLSQQALLVENAKRFMDRPEFVADVVKTVDHGVQRMRKLLLQLERAPASHEQRVELNELVRDAVARCAGNGVMPTFGGHRPLWVHAQPDRLGSVIGHVIANAREATKPGDSIAVTLLERDGRAFIEIRDSGVGMTQEFIRRRLFKPFDTTKGSSGMGIGVYQARELVRSLGGDIAVDSDVGIGTTVSITLPLAAAGERLPLGSLGPGGSARALAEAEAARAQNHELGQ
jgi:putative PEP-CTERM system histidine kinase